MKREFLKSIEGLTDEAIDKIIAENGKDIEATKVKTGQATEKVSQELENLKSELESNKQTLEQANAQIEKFKTLDVEGIKAQAEEWKTKYSEFENQTKAEKEAFTKQLADKDYEFAVKEFIGTQKFTGDFTKNAFIEDFKKQGLKLDNGKFLGADDYIKGFQEKNQGVFIIEAPIDEAPVPQFTKQQEGQPQDKGSMFNFGFNPLRPMPKE